MKEIVAIQGFHFMNGREQPFGIATAVQGGTL
jgi:hypothetical protein